MIGVEEAIARVFAEARPLPAERVPLDAAAGRALAEPLVACVDLPPFDDSSMDGWAVRASDLGALDAGAGEVTLSVAYAIHAGERAQRPLAPGECARIFTGAPLPEGADAVVKQEQVRTGPDGRPQFTSAVRARQNVRPRGSDVSAGATVIGAGATIGPGEMALLAAQGRAIVGVHRRPRVAVLATGDELRELGDDPSVGPIVASSSHALAAALRAAGAEPSLLGIARDDRADTRRRLEAGLAADVLLTTGGVSVGEHDFVKEALREAGCVERFWKVAIKPGKPIYFAVAPTGVLVFGLPGNPISTMVCFELFVRPALRRLGGHRATRRPEVEVRLDGSLLRRASKRREYVRARLRTDDEGRLWACVLEQQSSGALSSMVGVDALVVLPEEAADLHEGAGVRAMLLGAEPLGSVDQGGSR